MERLATIKEHAARQFYEGGYAATDLRSIAASVGIHVASLYNYISSKEELLYLIMKDGMTEIRVALDAALADVDSPADRLRAAVESHIAHHARRRYLAWTSHVEVRSLTGRQRGEILRLRHEYEERFLQILEEGRSTGAFTFEDPKIALYAVLSNGQSVSRWYKPAGSRQAEEIARLMAQQVLMGLIKR